MLGAVEATVDGLSNESDAGGPERDPATEHGLPVLPASDETESDETGREDGRTDGSTSHSPGSELTVDRLVCLLAHEYRRRVLAALAGQSRRGEAELTPERFASAAIERGGDSPEVVRLALRHVHLPKLDGAGIVARDRSDGTVARGPHFDAIEPLVETLDDLPAE